MNLVAAELLGTGLRLAIYRNYEGCVMVNAGVSLLGLDVFVLMLSHPKVDTYIDLNLYWLRLRSSLCPGGGIELLRRQKGPRPPSYTLLSRYPKGWTAPWENRGS